MQRELFASKLAGLVCRNAAEGCCGGLTRTGSYNWRYTILCRGEEYRLGSIDLYHYRYEPPEVVSDCVGPDLTNRPAQEGPYLHMTTRVAPVPPQARPGDTVLVDGRPEVVLRLLPHLRGRPPAARLTAALPCAAGRAPRSWRR